MLFGGHARYAGLSATCYLRTFLARHRATFDKHPTFNSLHLDASFPALPRSLVDSRYLPIITPLSRLFCACPSPTASYLLMRCVSPSAPQLSTTWPRQRLLSVHKTVRAKLHLVALCTGETGRSLKPLTPAEFSHTSRTMDHFAWRGNGAASFSVLSASLRRPAFQVCVFRPLGRLQCARMPPPHFREIRGRRNRARHQHPSQTIAAH